jgi:hypothetical protein
MRTTRRTVAVVGAMVAVGATTLMGIAAGTAAADAPGRCLDNVNVRAEPSMDARIVAVCEAGTAVQTDTVRDGFVQLTNLGGWAVAEYVEVDGVPVGAPGSAPLPAGGTEDADEAADDADAAEEAAEAAEDAEEAGSAEESGAGTTPIDEADATTTGPAAPPAAGADVLQRAGEGSGGPLAGLL